MANATLEQLQATEGNKRLQATNDLWDEIKKMRVVPILPLCEDDLKVGEYIYWGNYWWDSYGLFRIHGRAIHCVNKPIPYGPEKGIWKTNCGYTIPLHQEGIFKIAIGYSPHEKICRACLKGGYKGSKKKIVQSKS